MQPVGCVKLRCVACAGAGAAKGKVNVLPELRRVGNGPMMARVRCVCGWTWWSKALKAVHVARVGRQRLIKAQRQVGVVAAGRGELESILVGMTGPARVRIARLVKKWLGEHAPGWVDTSMHKELLRLVRAALPPAYRGRVRA